MNAKHLLAIAAFATLAAGTASADESDGSFLPAKFEGSRTRVEVMAEAATVSATRSTEPNGMRALPPAKSTLDVKQVRAEAAEAVRLGKISSGEVGRM